MIDRHEGAAARLEIWRDALRGTERGRENLNLKMLRRSFFGSFVRSVVARVVVAVVELLVHKPSLISLNDVLWECGDREECGLVHK